MAFRKRTGAFKKCNLTDSELVELTPICLPYLSELRKQQLHPAQLTAEFLFFILQKLRPKDWKGQSRAPEGQGLPGALGCFQKYSMRGTPESVNRALVNWYLGRFPLQLYFHKPTSEEVLHLQVRGERCVTIFSEAQAWLEMHDGRDAYSFILHDLIHADHFFGKPEWREGQIEFYKKCLTLWQLPEFQIQLGQDNLLREQFEYVYSDMNSHPQHLNQYLQSIQAQALSRRIS